MDYNYDYDIWYSVKENDVTLKMISDTEIDILYIYMAYKDFIYEEHGKTNSSELLYKISQTSNIKVLFDTIINKFSNAPDKSINLLKNLFYEL